MEQERVPSFCAHRFFVSNDDLEEAFLGEVALIFDSMFITLPPSQTEQLQLCETQILGHGSDATGEHGSH